jgi:polysaccharide chain length determinant protein (PEP-CTERM system associated)
MILALEKGLEAARSAWRFRSVGIMVAIFVALLGWLILFALPDKYETAARIFVDTRTALKPVLKNLTAEEDVDSEINFVRDSLLAGPQLEKIAVDCGVLPATITDPRQRTKILDKLANSVNLTVTSAGSPQDDRSKAGTIYSIEYRDTSPSRSFKVVETLLNTFVEQTLGGKREGSENAQRFLAERMKDYEQRLSEAENKIAAFKKANEGLLPSESGGYFTQLQGEIDASKKVNTALAVAISRRDELNRQLHSDVALSAGSSVTVSGAQGMTSGVDTLSRIHETQARLDELLLRFTDQHPDVIDARATLAELMKRRAKELEGLKSGDASAVVSSGISSSPIYQSIQLELNKTEVEIAALRREAAEHEDTVRELRARADTAPQVEAEYAQLSRDYEVDKAEYTGLLESFQKARLGEQADSAGSVRFEIVQPPKQPVDPISPQRTRLLAAIWVASIAIGCGFAYLLQRWRPVVSSERRLGEITRFPVLGAVSTAFPQRMLSIRRWQLLRFSAAAAVLVCALVLAMVLNQVGIRLNAGPFNGWLSL